MPALDSAEVIIGNNPLAWAIPRREGNPVVLDMAVSAVARGKIRLAASAGEPIPLGWAVDRDGRPTTDAVAALEGSLLPVGGAKGYGLAVVHELLSGALTGARMLTEISTRTITVGDLHDSWGIGHLLVAIDPDASVGLEEFFDRVEDAVAVLSQQMTRSGHPVLLPGAPEFERARRNSETGIALPANVVETLDKTADELGIEHLAASA
jgi:LDH2 family malate/lactate/ureidoglycolate dehydrogenase